MAFCMQKSGFTGVTGQSECSNGFMPDWTADPIGIEVGHALRPEESLPVPVSEVVDVIREEVRDHAEVAHLRDVLRQADLAVLDSEPVVGLRQGPQRILVGSQHCVDSRVAVGVGGDLVAPPVKGQDHFVQLVLLVDEPALLVGVAVVRFAQGRRDSLDRPVGDDLAPGDP